jgi:hypothetical protein
MFDVLATLRRSGPPYQLTPTQPSRSLVLTGPGMTNRGAIWHLDPVGRR